MAGTDACTPSSLPERLARTGRIARRAAASARLCCRAINRRLAYHGGELVLRVATIRSLGVERERDSCGELSARAWTGGRGRRNVPAVAFRQPAARFATALAVGGGVSASGLGRGFGQSGLGSRHDLLQALGWNGVRRTVQPIGRHCRWNHLDRRRAASVVAGGKFRRAQPFVAWSNSDGGSPQVYVRGDTLAVNRVMYTSAGISLNDVLEFNTMLPGDIVVIDAGTETHAGHTDRGPFRHLYSWVWRGILAVRCDADLADDADDITISRVDLAGGL